MAHGPDFSLPTLEMPLEAVGESLIGLAERGRIADATGDEPSAGPAAWTS